jgi:hypothetical protein
MVNTIKRYESAGKLFSLYGETNFRVPLFHPKLPHRDRLIVSTVSLGPLYKPNGGHDQAIPVGVLGNLDVAPIPEPR